MHELDTLAAAFDDPQVNGHVIADTQVGNISLAGVSNAYNKSDMRRTSAQKCQDSQDKNRARTPAGQKYSLARLGAGRN